MILLELTNNICCEQVDCEVIISSDQFPWLETIDICAVPEHHVICNLTNSGVDHHGQIDMFLPYSHFAVVCVDVQVL